MLSPLYIATIRPCDPVASPELETEVLPATRVPVPISAPLSVKVTVPVGVAPDPVTVEEKVTDCPKTDAFGEALTEVDDASSPGVQVAVMESAFSGSSSRPLVISADTIVCEMLTLVAPDATVVCSSVTGEASGPRKKPLPCEKPLASLIDSVILSPTFQLFKTAEYGASVAGLRKLNAPDAPETLTASQEADAKAGAAAPSITATARPHVTTALLQARANLPIKVLTGAAAALEGWPIVIACMLIPRAEFPA